MKSVRTLCLFVICAFLFSNCGRNNDNNNVQSSQDVTENSNAKKSSSDAASSVDLEHFTFKKTDDKKRISVRVFIELPKADNAVSTKIRKSVLALIDDKGETPQSCFNNYMKKCIQEYGISDEDWGDGYMEDEYSSVHDSIWAEVVHPQLIQFRTYSELYVSGAAHGMWGFSLYVFDRNTGKKLTEKDIFTDTKAVTNLLKTKGYENYLEENGLTESDSNIEKTNISANGNWGIDGNNLIYIFNPYEIAPYSEGVLTFSLNKKAVKPYMKPGTAVYKYWFGEEE